MNMKPVTNSSQVVEMGYEATGADTGTLRVRYKGGQAYDYADVPKDKWSELQAAESVGKYLARSVKPYYAAEKVGENPPASDIPLATEGAE